MGQNQLESLYLHGLYHSLETLCITKRRRPPIFENVLSPRDYPSTAAIEQALVKLIMHISSLHAPTVALMKPSEVSRERRLQHATASLYCCGPFRKWSSLTDFARLVVPAGSLPVRSRFARVLKNSSLKYNKVSKYTYATQNRT